MQPKNFVKIRHLYLSPNLAPVKLCLYFHLFILEEQIRWRNDENLCFASISSLKIYWLWCWFTEIEVRWEQSMLSFSFFIFFLPLGFCFWWCLKTVQVKRILLLSSKKSFFCWEKAWNNNAYLLCQWSWKVLFFSNTADMFIFILVQEFL